MTHPTAAAVMAALRAKGFTPTYEPPMEGCDAEISIAECECVTIQHCPYADGYSVNRWIESEQAMQHYPVRATIPEIMCELSAALTGE